MCGTVTGWRVALKGRPFSPPRGFRAVGVAGKCRRRWRGLLLGHVGSLVDACPLGSRSGEADCQGFYSIAGPRAPVGM